MRKKTTTSTTVRKHIVYALPGLGADRRMFAFQLGLDYEFRFIDWIAPKKDERMHDYAGRLSKLIDTTHPFSILGVSMGGMMCMEVAKFVKPEKIILVSSSKTWKELPPLLKILKKVKVYKLLPVNALKKMILFYSNRMGDLDGDMKFTFNHMVERADPEFLTWALNAIVHWDNETIHQNVYHIHGNKDRVLYHHCLTCDHTLEGGSHYMVGTRADEVNDLLKAVLP